MRFLVLSLEGDGYAVPIEGLLEITVPRDMLKDGSLTDSFEESKNPSASRWTEL